MRLFADRSSRRALAASVLLGALITGLSCSDSSDIGPGSITAVRVTPDTLRVLLGLTDTALAFPLDQDHAFLPKKSITWSTTDPAIATVNDSGIVTGVALGKTDITATVAGVTGTATVLVEPRPVMVFVPDSARITGIAGGPNPASSSDSVFNGGGGALTGLTVDSITYVSGATGWLQATLNGTFAPTSVDVVANTASVGLGQHVALVWFTSPDAPLPGSLPVVLTATPDVAASIALQAGNGQTATVNTAVALAPSVLVRDQFNNPVPNVAVTFAPVAGSGSVTGGNATTNANGIATVGSWTLGTTAGGNTLHATSAGLAGSPVTFTATGTAGAAANLSINGGNNQAAVAGTPVVPPPSAKVTDTFGNAVAGTTVTFAVTSGGGQITGATPASDAGGVAALGSWTLGTTAGTNTLSATAAGLTGSPLTFTATGNPGNATNIALNSGDGQSGTVGTALAGAYVVKVTDNNNNPVQGVTVGWAPTSGGGSMNPASSQTDVNGLASSTRTLGGTAGTQTATATVGGLIGSPVTFTATANPGAVTTLIVNAGGGQTATVNTAVGVAPSVVARDAFNNPVPGAAVTFTVTAGGGSVNCGSGATASCAVNTNGSGIATVTNWTLGTAAGTNNNTLSATRTLATGTSFTASATPGAVASVTIFQGNNQEARVGGAVAIDPAVQVRDAFTNVVPGAQVTFTITSGGNALVNCGAGNTTSCNATANASGVASTTAWFMNSSGVPTAGVPANGRYTNTLSAVPVVGSGSTSFTGFGIWSFSIDVQPIFTGRCVGCHFNGGTAPTLQSGSSYAAIRGVFSFSCGAYVAIGFNTTGSSFLFNKITSATPCGGGSLMPADGTAPLPTASINIIRDWINNSSPNN
jgi:Big-like domain-containing protein